ncbi:MAG TPA: hypothetical protein VIG33_06530, partial [Pseudobdellovibrionaceae bacterium]
MQKKSVTESSIKKMTGNKRTVPVSVDLSLKEKNTRKYIDSPSPSSIKASVSKQEAQWNWRQLRMI